MSAPDALRRANTNAPTEFARLGEPERASASGPTPEAGAVLRGLPSAPTDPAPAIGSAGRLRWGASTKPALSAEAGSAGHPSVSAATVPAPSAEANPAGRPLVNATPVPAPSAEVDSAGRPLARNRVLVVGSINIDDAVRVPRFPAPGETLSARSADTALGGKGANQAVAAARAGADVRMVGAVGAQDGTAVLAALEADGVDVEGVTRLDGVPSGRAFVFIDDAAENSIVVVAGANHAIPEAAVREACTALRPGDVLLLQNEVPAETSRLAAGLAREGGASVVWNAAPAPESSEELVDRHDLLLVNEHELGRIATLLGVTDTSLEPLLGKVAAAIGADVICTLGDEGAVYRVGGETGRAAARQVAAVDTTAAGDTFAGYFAALADLPLPQRLRRALDAASLAVTRPGASTSIPMRADVEALDRYPGPPEQISAEAGSEAPEENTVERTTR